MDVGGLYNIDLEQLRGLFPPSSCVGMENEFFVISLKYDKGLGVLRHPCRFDGYLAFFCISGHLKVTINLTEFEVSENSLFINLPENIIRISWVEEASANDLDFVVIALTKDYMSGLKADMASLMDEGRILLDNPGMVLDDRERLVAGKYLRLVSSVLESDIHYKKECMASLVSSLFYFAGGMVEKRVSREKAERQSGRSRDKTIFNRFRELVAAYHVRERGVAFYAGELCLTPKYLSRVVKSVSGRSAPEWIDAFVIMEAKNLLKYSDMPIKEVATRLNFSDNAAFYKFFKARTGVTPLKYRRS